MKEGTSEELADFLRFCASVRRLAPMTCSAYERGVSACLDYLTGQGIEDLAEVRVTPLRALLASPHGRDANVGGGVRRHERCGLRNLSGRLAERATGAA